MFMNMKYLFLSALLVLVGCGGKDEGASKSERTQSHLEVVDNGSVTPMADSDGDGILDKDDPEPFLADVPVVGGEFFNKMRVELWSTGTVSSKVATWEINWDGIDVGAKALSSTKRPVPRSMVDYYLKKGARASGWKAEQVPLEINTDYLIDSFASPLLNREEMLKISSSLFKRDLSSTLSANIDFQSDFSISSSNFKNFKDLTLSVFYLTPSGDVRELDNIYVPGQYEFNAVYPIANRIQLRDQDAVDALIVSGSRLFVKVSDFTVIDTGEKYRDILYRVREKSLPLVISTGNAKPETYYVGVDGRKSGLKSVVERVFGENQVRISGSSVDSIRGLSNRLTRRDDWSNEFSQWVVGTNQYLSPYEVAYSPKDTITLGYYSNYEEDSYPVFMQRQDVDQHNFFTGEEAGLQYKQRFVLEDVSQKIEFVIRDDKFLVPHQKISKYKTDCGYGDWMVNEVKMRKFEIEHKSMDVMDALKNAYVEVSNYDGIIVRERVGSSQIVDFKRDERTREIVVSVNDLWKFGNKLGRLFVNLEFIIPQVNLRVGEEVAETRCVKWPRTPLPHRGNEIKEPEDISSFQLQASQYRIFDSQFSGLITVLGY